MKTRNDKTFIKEKQEIRVTILLSAGEFVGYTVIGKNRNRFGLGMAQ